MRYVLRRLGYLIFVLLGASFLVFFLAQAIPADPAREAMGEYATNEQVEAYRHERGLDRPIVVQYAIYLNRLLRVDLGTSVMTGEPVVKELFRYLPATVELAAASLIVSVVLGIFLGVASAAKRGYFTDQFSRVFALFGMSMPVFWFGLMLQLIFYRHLAILPIGQRMNVEFNAPPAITGLLTVDSLMAGDLTMFVNALLHLVLPSVVLASGSLASIARITRSNLLEVLRSEYVRTARSKGLAERTVIYKHAFRSTLVPVVTIIGLQVGHVFSGAVLAETVFTWPGIGRWAVSGILKGDVPVVMGVALFTTAVYSLVNLLVDLSYPLIDPRLRTA